MKINRKEFLKTAGLGSVSLILPGTSPKPELVKNLISRPIKIYDNYLRGVQYYDLEKCFKQIKPGDTVRLQRFAEHQHDRFAIGVRWEDLFLGYLPAYENIVLANLMDAGANLRAMVTTKQSFYELGIGIWTELIVSEPKSPHKLSDQAADNIDDEYRR